VYQNELLPRVPGSGHDIENKPFWIRKNLTIEPKEVIGNDKYAVINEYVFLTIGTLVKRRKQFGMKHEKSGRQATDKIECDGYYLIRLTKYQSRASKKTNV
jgi:hypothetical protein